MKKWTKIMIASTSTIATGSIVAISALQIDKLNNPNKYQLKKYVLPNVFDASMSKSQIIQKINSLSLDEINQKLKTLKMEQVTRTQVYVANGKEFVNIEDAQNEIINNIKYTSYYANTNGYQNGMIADNNHQIKEASVNIYYEYKNKIYPNKVEAQTVWLQDNPYKITPLSGQGSFTIMPFNKSVRIPDWDYNHKPTKADIIKDLRVGESPLTGHESKAAQLGMATLSIDGARVIESDGKIKPNVYLENGDITNYFNITNFHKISVDGLKHVWSVSAFGNKYRHVSKEMPNPVLTRKRNEGPNVNTVHYKYFIDWGIGDLQEIEIPEKYTSQKQEDAYINMILLPIDETITNHSNRYVFTLDGIEFTIESLGQNTITQNDIHLNLEGSAPALTDTRFKKYELIWKNNVVAEYRSKINENFQNPFDANNLRIEITREAHDFVRNVLNDAPDNVVREYPTYDTLNQDNNNIQSLMAINFTKGYKYNNKFYNTRQDVADAALNEANLSLQYKQDYYTFYGTQYKNINLALEAAKQRLLKLVKEVKDREEG